MKTKLGEYASDIGRLASGKVNSRVSNSGIEHAAIVIENLFLHSMNVVKVLCGKFSEDVYGRASVKLAIDAFLSKTGTRLEICVTETSDQNAVVRALIAKFPERVTFRSTNTSDVKYHFAVGDLQAYRLETDMARREAVVNFNEPSIAFMLDQVFEAICTSPSKHPA
jgi:hypothetical protein